jgi:hypothetical protein
VAHRHLAGVPRLLSPGADPVDLEQAEGAAVVEVDVDVGAEAGRQREQQPQLGLDVLVVAGRIETAEDGAAQLARLLQ